MTVRRGEREQAADPCYDLRIETLKENATADEDAIF